MLFPEKKIPIFSEIRTSNRNIILSRYRIAELNFSLTVFSDQKLTTTQCSAVLQYDAYVLGGMVVLYRALYLGTRDNDVNF